MQRLRKGLLIASATQSCVIVAIVFKTVPQQIWTTCRFILQPTVFQTNRDCWGPLRYSAKAEPPCLQTYNSPHYDICWASSYEFLCWTKSSRKSRTVFRRLSTCPAHMKSLYFSNRFQTTAAGNAHDFAELQECSSCTLHERRLLSSAILHRLCMKRLHSSEGLERMLHSSLAAVQNVPLQKMRFFQRRLPQRTIEHNSLSDFLRCSNCRYVNPR